MASLISLEKNKMKKKKDGGGIVEKSKVMLQPINMPCVLLLCVYTCHNELLPSRRPI